MPAEFESIVYEAERGQAWITLNRPDKLNAISPGMIEEMHVALDRAEADGTVRVIGLKGEGRAFSAGFDLDADSDYGEGLAGTRAELQADFDIIMRFWESPKPTVAAVHGYCLGGALELAVACDITLTAEDARFGAPEVRFGSGIVGLIYPWICGPKFAKELLLVGDDRLSAHRVAEWGLVNRVVDPPMLLDEARQVARQIARNDELAVRLTKLAVNRSMEVAGMAQALRQALELDVIIEGTETEESRQFNEILRTEGTRAAVAWRDSRKMREESE